MKLKPIKYIEKIEVNYVEKAIKKELDLNNILHIIIEDTQIIIDYKNKCKKNIIRKNLYAPGWYNLTITLINLFENVKDLR